MSRKTTVTRFSVSLPPPLVEDFDQAWKAMQYDNRSKAIHDAVRSFITEFEWMRAKAGRVTGAVLALYYLNKPGLLEEIAKIQHQFRQVISSSLHIHLEGDKCLEIMAIEGGVEEVKRLTQLLMTRKGVKQVKAAAMAP